MRIIAITFLVCAAFLPTQLCAQEQNESYGQEENEGWQISASAGAFYAPTYLGDDDYQLSVFPNITVKYDDLFFASLEGVGFNVINRGGFRAGPIMKYDFGRDEDGDNPLGVTGGTNDLIGLGDVDGTIELGAFAEYSSGDFSGKIELRQGVNGHEGLVGEAQLKYGRAFDAFGRTAFFSVGPEISFGDKKFNSAFFDVNAVQSAASGLSAYDAGGGLNSFGFHGSLVLPVTDRISAIGFAGYDRLSGDIADSSLVQERGSKDQALVGFLLSYRF